MKFAKSLLVALTLWMPAASFAAVVASGRAEQATPCEEQAPEESSDLSEHNEMLFTSSVVPLTIGSAHTVHHESHRPLDGHIAELHSPPPNHAVLR